MTASHSPRPRPLSPHIQIYRWQINMVTSILHRITGGALVVGLAVLAWGLFALASGPEAFALFQSVARSPIGVLALLGWSVALFYHLTNGIRHLIQDCGYLLTRSAASSSGWVVLIVTALLTAIAWGAPFYLDMLGGKP